jgi:hypothetical protein
MKKYSLDFKYGVAVFLLSPVHCCLWNGHLGPGNCHCFGCWPQQLVLAGRLLVSRWCQPSKRKTYCVTKKLLLMRELSVLFTCCWLEAGTFLVRFLTEESAFCATAPSPLFTLERKLYTHKNLQINIHKWMEARNYKSWTRRKLQIIWLFWQKSHLILRKSHAALMPKERWLSKNKFIGSLTWVNP